VALHRWVGDGDSLGEAGIAALVAAGVAVARAPVDKDETDAELAILAAIDAGADRLTILGALGGDRVDHGLANVGLLALPALARRDARVVASDARLRLVTAPGPDGGPVSVELEGRVGDIVTLLPVGDDVVGVTTRGLRYPLRDEPLHLGRTRGVSNLRETSPASVTVRRGRLLVVEAPATL
jgi:thiamine pyrophosphokinase